MPGTPSIVSILYRYSRQEELTADERKALGDWLEESLENQRLFDEMSDRQSWQASIDQLQAKDDRATWKIIEKRIRARGGFPQAMPYWKKYAMAAAVIMVAIVIGEGIVQFRKQHPKPVQIPLVAKQLPDIHTGDQFAILTSKGITTMLDSAGMHQVEVARVKGQRLIYDRSVQTLPGDSNTIRTPKGTTFSLVLSDGTGVWLNGGSSLLYPVQFGKGPRVVMLTGEGYFEVARDKSRPFLVQTTRGKIEVLGTHFNVKNYANLEATLLEGSIRFSNELSFTLLKPGEQGVIDDKPGRILISRPNLEEVLAWRKNTFYFDSVGYDQILRELANWYPMKVRTQGLFTNHFTGVLPRDRSLRKLLSVLEESGHVKFTIAGDTVTAVAR